MTQSVWGVFVYAALKRITLSPRLPLILSPCVRALTARLYWRRVLRTATVIPVWEISPQIRTMNVTGFSGSSPRDHAHTIQFLRGDALLHESSGCSKSGCCAVLWWVEEGIRGHDRARETGEDAPFSPHCPIECRDFAEHSSPIHC